MIDLSTESPRSRKSSRSSTVASPVQSARLIQSPAAVALKRARGPEHERGPMEDGDRKNQITRRT
jgi:hypothetical protein